MDAKKRLRIQTGMPKSSVVIEARINDEKKRNRASMYSRNIVNEALMTEEKKYSESPIT